MPVEPAPSTGGPELVPRSPSAALRAAVRAVLAGPDPSFLLETSLAEMGKELALRIADPELAADIDALAREYARRTGAERLAIRFERVTGSACKYFHVDYVRLRLIVTYAGPGTEYVLDSDADRTALGSGDNRRIVPDRSRVRRVPRFAAAFFGGVEGGTGVVHRSPRASSLRPRLLLVVDAAEVDRSLTVFGVAA
jgi:hypothetical protein